MIANLHKEQSDDNGKKAYCLKSLDHADDSKKAYENSITDHETTIDELNGKIQTTTEEILALEAGIKALDKAVADASAQRKRDNADYKELMANDGAAKELLLWAQNRLNKWYNPKLYKPAPKRDLSEEDRIVVNMDGTLAPTFPSGIADTGITASFAQIAAQAKNKKDVVAPPPPP